MQTLEKLDRRAELSEWRSAVKHLLRDIEQWSEIEGWQVIESKTSITEDQFGKYAIPKLELRLPNGRVLFAEPRYRFISGAKGRVDLWAYPTLERVMLLRKGGEWIIRAEMGPNLPIPWNKEGFVSIACALVD